MKKKRFPVVWVIIAVVVVGAGVYVAYRWNRPMGMGLNLPTDTLTTTGEAPAVGISTPGVDQANTTPNPGTATTPQGGIVATLNPAVKSQPVCGKVPLMYILAVGADATDPSYVYGLADVIRIFRIDFVTPKVTVFTLPRDLYVQFPDIIPSEAADVQWGRINQAYFFGNPGMKFYTGPGEGPGLLARTIAFNFDLNVDHYAAINMAVFEQIIDAMGGIDVYLNAPIDGHLGGGDVDVNAGYFPAGWNHLNGLQTLNLSRIRNGYGEPVRTDHQTLLLYAINDKLRQPSTLPAIPQIISLVVRNGQTDLTPAQISDLVCLFPKISRENLQFYRFPDSMLTMSREPIAKVGVGFVWTYDSAKIKEFINQFETDTLSISPTPEPTSVPSPTP